MTPLLKVEGLNVRLRQAGPSPMRCADVSFGGPAKGETGLALVGEKRVRQVGHGAEHGVFVCRKAQEVEGSIYLRRGPELLAWTKRRWRKGGAATISSFIFQEPMTSLTRCTPSRTVG